METERKQDNTHGIINVCQVYCGQSFNERGAIAPCAQCEWCGICPQHFDEAEDRNAGSRKTG